MKFRKKPVVIEALQWNGENSIEVSAFCPTIIDLYDTKQFLLIPTKEGDMKASVNDWIIKGVQGEFYPCKPDIFEATYESVGGDG